MSKRSTLVVFALATVAFAAPAFGQTYTRDHRVPVRAPQAKPPIVRDHRAPTMPAPIARNRRPSARNATTVGAFDVVTPRPAPAWGVRVNANASWRVGFDRNEREWVQSRRGRRANRAKQYQRRWRRAFLRDAKTQAELTLHARRVAKLERMKRIATARDNARLTRRIDIAIKRENLRHDRKMAQLEQAFFA